MKTAICAGGTGGHIFPGIAVAEALMTEDVRNEVVFIGTTQGLEGGIIPKAGFRLLYVEAHQFLGKSIFGKLFTIIRLLNGVIASFRLLGRERPDAVLGMGGFTSVPVIIAGLLRGIPTFIHEQNVQPGLANKFLSRCTRMTFISFQESSNQLPAKKILYTGNPLRKRLFEGRTEGIKEKFGIFIFGGSRGARSINDAVIGLLPYLKGNAQVVLYHQTGRDDYERVARAYADMGIDHEVFPFTNEMEKYYRLSDVVIARSGATTIFELAYFNRAAILIPYPYSAGGHQWKNAFQAENIGGAFVIANEEATGEKLFDAIKHLMDEPGLITEMGKNIGRLYVADAAERIVGGIKSVLA